MIEEMSWSFEVTRRCRCKCAHCCRGEAQPKEMSPDDLDRILHTLPVNMVHLTGGEPLLHKDIVDILYRLRLNGYVSWVSIITSGNIPENRINSIVEQLYLIQSSHMELYLSFSEDYFHTGKSYTLEEELSRRGIEIGVHNTTKHKEAMFFGRSATNSIGFAKAEDKYYPIGHKYFTEGSMMVNVFGDVYLGCEWSYKAQKKFKKEVCLGNLLENSLQEIEEAYIKLVGETGIKLIYSENEITIEALCKE